MSLKTHQKAESGKMGGARELEYSVTGMVVPELAKQDRAVTVRQLQFV